MAAFAHLQNLHAQITNILAVPSLLSYSRALSTIEEFTKIAKSSPNPHSPAILALKHNCNVYKMLCNKSIRHLIAQASAHEHKMYRRASPRARGNVERGDESQHKRRGIVFNLDSGEHVFSALEALTLVEFLEEQECRSTKQVRFAN
ncbi:hypothetical protein E0Z10_g130 [Xylaria hypoxylon]|uniref:Uncharacterized protein n=1 Tax=Xylaria hypoxylon TaxID=37992 RepID=A0A4Z0ZA68_9PEZI|nr:hypothetical protein E0Z10_g130 [Xylaria hypoxylon]